MAKAPKVPKRLLKKTLDEGVQAAAEAGAAKGAAMRKKQLNKAIKANTKAAIEESYQGALKEASMPKFADEGTDMYFRAGGVEYRSIVSNVDINGQQVRQRVYGSRNGRTGEYQEIRGENFREAQEKYGGKVYSSYEDMLLGDGGHAADISQTAAGEHAGFDLGQAIQDHPVIAMGIAAGGGILAANLFDDDDY